MRRWVGAAVAAAALLAGCSDPPPTNLVELPRKEPPKVPAKPADLPAIRIEAPEQPAFGAPTEARAVIENTTARPIVLGGIVLETAGGRSIARLDEPGRVTVARTGEGNLVLDGSYMVEDIGPQARSPAPPRWRYEGDVILRTAPILAPGRTFALAGSFSADQDLGGALRVVVTFAPLDPGATLYKVTRAQLKAAAGGGAPQPGIAGGWVAAARARAPLAKAGAGAVGPDAADLLAWAPDPGVEVPGRYLPKLYPFVFDERAYTELFFEQAGTERALAAAAPGLAIKTARAKAGIPAGPAVYFPAAEAWLLEAEGRSVLVSAARSVEARPTARALVEALNSVAASVRVTLYGYAKTKDPDGLAASLAKAGFTVEEREQKGGTYTAAADVKAEKLFEFLEALRAKGLGLEGTRVVKP